MKLRDHFPITKLQAKKFNVEFEHFNTVFKVFIPDVSSTLTSLEKTIIEINDFLVKNGYKAISPIAFIKNDFHYVSQDEIVSISRHGYLEGFVVFISNENNLTRYGLTALTSVQNFKGSYSIIEIWLRSAKEVFPLSKSSQEKGCPKGTFLGLCEEGLVKGIPKGNYTKSVKNKKYALKAIEILKQNTQTTFSPKELWEQLELGDKRSNSQMDVVLALWENGLIMK
jgi:hypothetical protein